MRWFRIPHGRLCRRIPIIFIFPTVLMGLTFGFTLAFITIRSLQTTFSFLLSPCLRNMIAGDIVDFSVADNITGFPYIIVPNWVHFIKFHSDQLTFFEMVNIRAAYKFQKPERIIIHCDCNQLQGKYWDMLQDIKELEVHTILEPKYIFGQPVGHVYHASDIARIRILMEYGGIFLDNDVYLVRSFDTFRKFEFAHGWQDYYSMGTQVLVAHRNARMLRCWLEGYKQYRPDLWYHNAGFLPTSDCVNKDTCNAHSEEFLFGVHMLGFKIYHGSWPEWKDQYSVHLLMRHRYYLDEGNPIGEFDEFNIRTYNHTYGEMARWALFGTTELLPEIEPQSSA